MKVAYLKLGLGGLGVLAAAWAGATVYSHHVVESELSEFVASPDPRSNLKFSNFTHHAGLLDSAGSVDLAWKSPCSPTAQADTVPLGHVEYSVSHVILPTGLQRFRWTMEPSAKANQVFKAIFGPGARLEGEGTVGLTGLIETAVALPAFEHADETGGIQATPSQLTVAFGRTSLASSWTVGKLTFKGPHGVVELENFALKSDLPDRQLSAGNFTVSADKFSGTAGIAEGLRLTVGTVQSGDVVAWHFNPSLREAHLGAQVLKDLNFDLYAKDLQRAELQKVLDLTGSSCGLNALSPNDQRVLAGAVSKLIAHGFSFGVEGLRGTVGNGSLASDVKVEVQALTDADPHAIHLEQQVRGSGTMLVKGDALSREQLQTILQTGFAESTPDGVRLAFDYADGILHVNGRPLNAAMVQGFLAQVDGAINPILARNAVPLTAPESVAEQPVAAGPGAPAAAPSAEALAPQPTPVAQPTPVSVPAPVAQPTALAIQPPAAPSPGLPAGPPQRSQPPPPGSILSDADLRGAVAPIVVDAPATGTPGAAQPGSAMGRTAASSTQSHLATSAAGRASTQAANRNIAQTPTVTQAQSPARPLAPDAQDQQTAEAERLRAMKQRIMKDWQQTP